MNFFTEPFYRSFSPPNNFNNPKEVDNYIFSESQDDPQRTRKYLKRYQPKNNTLGKQKAKEYWLSGSVEDQNKEYFEKIRKEHPQEVEKLRKKIWKHHVIKMAEDDLRESYRNKETTPALPDDFTDLESYWKVEEHGFMRLPMGERSRPLKEVIEKFPEATEEIIWAKKYILGDVSPEEKENIPEKYLPQVKIFRQLLWERHLKYVEIKEENEKERAEGREEAIKIAEERRRKSNQKFLIAATLIVTAVVSFFFSRGKTLEPKFSSINPQLGVLFFKSAALIERLNRTSESSSYCPCGGGHFHCAYAAAQKLAKL